MKEIKINNLDEIIYEFISDSGLKVYVWPSKISDKVNATLTIKYGSIYNNFKINNKIYHMPKGMAHFLEHIKFNEKKGITAHDFYSKLGSYVNAYTTYDHTTYEVVCNDFIKDNIEHLLYFVYNPYFTKSIIQKEKGIIISESKISLSNPLNVGYNALLNNLFVNDEKKFLITGLPEDIKKITYEDAKLVFENFYHPKNMFLVITGNVNVFEIEKIVNEFFKDRKFDKYQKPIIIKKKDEDRVNKKGIEINQNVGKEKSFLGIKIPRKYFKDFNELEFKMIFYLILRINFGATSEFYEYLEKNNLIDHFSNMFLLEDDHVVVMFEISSEYSQKVNELIIQKFKNLEVNENDFIRKRRSILAGMILNFESPIEVNSIIRSDLINYDRVVNDEKEIFEKITMNDINKLINSIKNFETTNVYLLPKKKNQ